MSNWIAGLFLLAVSVPALCQQVTVVTEDFPPYNYEEDGTAKGVSSEVVQAVLDEIDMEAAFHFYPWVRAYRIALNKENHLIYSIARIPEREDMFHWVGAIAPYNTSLYKLKSRKDIEINSLDDARPYIIGSSRADVITAYLEDKGGFDLDVVTRDSQNLHRLLLGRVDLIAYDEASLVYKVQQEGLDITLYERVYRLEDLSDDLYMAFGKTSDISLVKKFQEGLRSIKDKGIFDKIRQKYFLQ